MMFILFILCVIVIAYVCWCLHRNKPVVHESFEEYHKMGGRKLNQFKNDDGSFDLEYSPKNLENLKISNTRLTEENMDLNSNIVFYNLELTRVSNEIQAITSSNQLIQQTIDNTQLLVDNLKEYINTNYFNQSKFNESIGYSAADFYDVNKVQTAHVATLRFFDAKVQIINNMITKEDLKLPPKDSITNEHIETLHRSLNTIKSVYESYFETIHGITNIEVDHPSMSSIDGIYEKMRSNCESKTGTCWKSSGVSGSSHKLSQVEYGFRFDSNAWLDNNCIALNQDCYDETTFTCTGMTDTCYFNDKGQVDSTTHDKTVHNDGITMSCVSRTPEVCYTQDEAVSQIQNSCSIDNHDCYTVSNNTVVSLDYSKKNMNDTTNQCIIQEDCSTLDQAKEQLSNYCSSCNQTCYQYNTADQSVTTIANVYVFTDGSTAYFEDKGADRVKCWTRTCELNSNTHTNPHVLCEKNTMTCYQYNEGSNQIDATSNPKGFDSETNKCVGSCEFSTPLAVCQSRSNLCSNGTFSINEYDDVTNSCIDTCPMEDNVNQEAEETCLSNNYDCYTVSNNTVVFLDYTNKQFVNNQCTECNCSSQADANKLRDKIEADSNKNACESRSNVCYMYNDDDIYTYSYLNDQSSGFIDSNVNRATYDETTNTCTNNECDGTNQFSTPKLACDNIQNRCDDDSYSTNIFKTVDMSCKSTCVPKCSEKLHFEDEYRYFDENNKEVTEDDYKVCARKIVKRKNIKEGVTCKKRNECGEDFFENGVIEHSCEYLEHKEDINATEHLYFMHYRNNENLKNITHRYIGVAGFDKEQCVTSDRTWTSHAHYINDQSLPSNIRDKYFGRCACNNYPPSSWSTAYGYPIDDDGGAMYGMFNMGFRKFKEYPHAYNYSHVYVNDNLPQVFFVLAGKEAKIAGRNLKWNVFKYDDLMQNRASRIATASYKLEDYPDDEPAYFKDLQKTSQSTEELSSFWFDKADVYIEGDDGVKTKPIEPNTRYVLMYEWTDASFNVSLRYNINFTSGNFSTPPSAPSDRLTGTFDLKKTRINDGEVTFNEYELSGSFDSGLQYGDNSKLVVKYTDENGNETDFYTPAKLNDLINTETDSISIKTTNIKKDIMNVTIYLYRDEIESNKIVVDRSDITIGTGASGSGVDVNGGVNGCTSNDINYKFEVFGPYNNRYIIPFYYKTDIILLIHRANSITLSKSDYDGYDDSHSFTITQDARYLYSSGFSYTFTKSDWETDNLPYLDTTSMIGFIPTQIRLTKTYDTECALSTDDPSLGEPVFKNISTTPTLI